MPEASETNGLVKPVFISVVSTVVGGAVMWIFGFGGGDTINLNAGDAMLNEPPTVSEPVTAIRSEWSHEEEKQARPWSSSPSSAELSGGWLGDDGWLYQIQQPVSGRISVVAVDPNWQVVMIRGNGTVNGREVNLQYQLHTGVPGEAQFQLSADGQQLSGRYQHAGIRAALVLDRTSLH